MLPDKWVSSMRTTSECDNLLATKEITSDKVFDVAPFFATDLDCQQQFAKKLNTHFSLEMRGCEWVTN